MKSRLLAPAVLSAGLIVAAACTPAALAHVAGVPRWHIVTVLRHCRDTDSLASVTATGPDDAWAVGESYGPGRCNPDVEHWDGTSWQEVLVPGNPSIGYSLNPPITATSARNAWIFPFHLLLGQHQTSEYSSALHWNGRRWRRSSFPVKLLVTSAAALGEKDVWAFGQVYRQGKAAIPYSARYDGQAWHQARLPGTPFAVSALTSSDLWAIGPSVATASKLLIRQSILAMHWDGRSWHTIGVPAIKAGKGQRSLGSASVAAVGPRDVWWSYERHTAEPSPVVLLHWDGAAWHQIKVPTAITGSSTMTQDGQGGIWLLADIMKNFDVVQYWYHYAGDLWTRQQVPTPSKYNTSLFGMAWIPGTATAWAVGEADRNSGGGTTGVIARYGP